MQISLDLPEISETGASEYLQTVVEDTVLGEVLQGDSFNDIEAVAGILGSRHPRHIKRFLNDLSMTLAMLRNSNRLGDQPSQLSERVVVACGGAILDSNGGRDAAGRPMAGPVRETVGPDRSQKTITEQDVVANRGHRWC